MKERSREKSLLLFYFLQADALSSIQNSENKIINITCTGAATNTSGLQVICSQALGFDALYYSSCELNGSYTIKFTKSGSRYSTTKTFSNQAMSYNVSLVGAEYSSSGYYATTNIKFDQNNFYIRGINYYGSTNYEIEVSDCDIAATFINKQYS